ncbi:unnamed protein product [Lampetra planeri]
MLCFPVHGGAALPGACPGLCDTSHCPAPCPAGTVCDGLKCVDPADCPCFVRGIARKSGYIWKENAGCTTCMCVAGQTQCVDEQCSICSCAEGEHPVVPEGECCPVCVPMPYACRDQRGNEYRLGEVFALPYDACQQCTCTEAGLSCSIVVCADTSRPCCGPNEMLVQVNVGACCPVYECVCNKSSCSEVRPACNDYEDLVVTNPGACCEEFACRCNPNKCPLPAVCALNQRRVRVNNDTECCAVYKCESPACVSAGLTYQVGEKWSPNQDVCVVCECRCDGVSVYEFCTATQCPEVDPGCPLNAVKTTADGCCKYCDYKAVGCSVSSAPQFLEANGCVSETPVNMTQCDGQCSSQSVYSAASNAYQKECSCCSALETVTLTATLLCPDGSRVLHAYEAVTRCACMSSQPRCALANSLGARCVGVGGNREGGEVTSSKRQACLGIITH